MCGDLGTNSTSSVSFAILGDKISNVTVVDLLSTPEDFNSGIETLSVYKVPLLDEESGLRRIHILPVDLPLRETLHDVPRPFVRRGSQNRNRRNV